MFQDVRVEQSSRRVLPSLYPHLCRRNSPALLFALNRRWLGVGLWLQCGDTGCLPEEEEVNLQGNLGREQVPKSRFPGPMAAQVRPFCRTKSKVVWETRIFSNDSLAVMFLLCIMFKNTAGWSKILSHCCKLLQITRYFQEPITFKYFKFFF